MRYVIFVIQDALFVARQDVFESIPFSYPITIVDMPKTMEYVRDYQRDINRPIIFIGEVIGAQPMLDITRPDKYAALELDEA